MSVYADGTSDDLGYAVSVDGENYVYNDHEISLPGVSCGYSGECSAGIAVYNDTIYVAYPEVGTGALDVVTATPIPNNVGYSWNLVYRDASIQLTTTPTVFVDPQGYLDFIYGSSSYSPVKNCFFEERMNSSGAWSNTNLCTSGAGLISSASKPGVAMLGSTLWLVSQQNGNPNLLFVYNSSDGINWNFVGNHTNLSLGSGANMVNYRGNLVFATKQNSSNNALFIFSSPDGYNWSAQEYPNYRIGGTPALTLFGSGISLSFKANDSGNALYGSFTTN
jgi:hypothetical protein